MGPTLLGGSFGVVSELAIKFLDPVGPSNVPGLLGREFLSKSGTREYKEGGMRLSRFKRPFFCRRVS
jgi:hypothetical protein